MCSHFTLPVILLSGCAPVIDASLDSKQTTSDDGAASSGIDWTGEESDEDPAGSDGSPSGDGAGTEDAPDADGGEDDDGSGDDPGTEAPMGQIASGTWVRTDADIIDDPCRWNGLLGEFSDLTLFTFLPSSFTVDASEDQFQIKALDYGARDNIVCTVSGGDFACSLQTVDALAVLDGWPRNWIYEIDFRGTVVDEERLVGVASVEYPQVNPGDDYYLLLYGMEHTECGQSFELTLQLR